MSVRELITVYVDSTVVGKGSCDVLKTVEIASLSKIGKVYSAFQMCSLRHILWVWYQIAHMATDRWQY
jgi:hypothetical protein